MKSRAQHTGESDLSATRTESAVPTLAAENADSVRASRAKKVATSVDSVDLAHEGHSISGIMDAILEIGRQRSTLLADLRVALESGKEKEALNFARRLCGL